MHKLTVLSEDPYSDYKEDWNYRTSNSPHWFMINENVIDLKWNNEGI